MGGCCSCGSGSKTATAQCAACYPTDEKDIPHSSNLSYLVFYLQNHPNKLKLVTDYITARFSRDTINLNRVSLKILIDILDGCADHLLLFSPQILLAVTETIGQNELIDLSLKLFISFSKNWNHSQNDILPQYSNLLKTICDMASSSKENAQPALECLHYVASNTCFFTNKEVLTFVDFIFPTVIKCYYQRLAPHGFASKGTLKELLDSSTSEYRDSLSSPPHATESAGIITISSSNNRKNSSQQEQPKPIASPTTNLPDSKIPEYLDAIILNFCQESTTETLKRITSCTTKVLLEFNHVATIQKIMQTLLRSFKTAYLYIPTTNLLEKIDIDSSDAEKLVYIILLTDVISTFGCGGTVTCLELCVSLQKSLLYSLKSSPILLTNEICMAIGSLGKHIQYPDQVNDIVSYLVNRLALPSSSSGIPAQNGGPDNMKTVRLWTLKSLLAITRIRLLFASGPDGSKLVRRPSLHRTPMNQNVISPLLAFLGDIDVEIRQNTLHLTRDLIQLEEFDTTGSFRFHTSLIRNLYTYISSPKNTTKDYQELNKLGMTLANCRVVQAEFFSMLVAVESASCSSTELSDKQTRCVGNLIIELLESLAKNWQTQQLLEYLLNEKRTRIENGTFEPVPLKEEEEETNLNAHKKPLDLKTLLELIKQNTEFVETSSSEFMSRLETPYNPSKVVVENAIRKAQVSMQSISAFSGSISITKKPGRLTSVSADSSVDESQNEVNPQELKDMLEDPVIGTTSDEAAFSVDEKEVNELLHSVGRVDQQPSVVFDDIKEPDLA